MIVDNLKKLICEHPETDLVILNRLIYIKLVHELHGSIKVENVRVYSNEEVKEDEVQLYGEIPIKLKRDLRKFKE